MASPEEIRTLEVVLTASCNLACTYCYQNAKQSKRMSWDTLRAAIDLLLGSQQNELNILFIGGEPLLEAPLIERAVEYVAQSKRSVRFSMSTNGLLLTDELAAFLASHQFTTQLSFDGVPAAQRERGVGSHARLDVLLDRLRQTQPAFFRQHLTVNITVLAHTIRHLADSIAYFLRKDVRTIALGPRWTHEPGWNDGGMTELEQQFEKIYRLSLRYYRRTGLIPVEILRRDQERSVHKPRGLQMCGVGSGEVLAIDVDGEVSGCATFSRSYQAPSKFLRERFDAMAMGNVRSVDFPQRLAMYPAAARAAEIFDKKQDKFSSYGTCGECRHFGVCTVCPTSIGHIPGNEDPRRIPDFLCAFNLVALDCRDRFPRQPTSAEALIDGPFIPAVMRDLLQSVGPRQGTSSTARRPRGGRKRSQIQTTTAE